MTLRKGLSDRTIEAGQGSQQSLECAIAQVRIGRYFFALRYVSPDSYTLDLNSLIAIRSYPRFKIRDWQGMTDVKHSHNQALGFHPLSV